MSTPAVTPAPAPADYSHYAALGQHTARELLAVYPLVRPNDYAPGIDDDNAEFAYKDMVCDIAHGIAALGADNGHADPQTYALSVIAAGLGAFLMEHRGAQTGAEDECPLPVRDADTTADRFAELLRSSVDVA